MDNKYFLFKKACCREQEKPAHGKCLPNEPSSHHLSQNLFEMISWTAFLEQNKSLMIEFKWDSWIPDLHLAWRWTQKTNNASSIKMVVRRRSSAEDPKNHPATKINWSVFRFNNSLTEIFLGNKQVFYLLLQFRAFWSWILENKITDCTWRRVHYPYDRDCKLIVFLRCLKT